MTVPNETAAMLHDVRETIAKIEAHIAKFRRTSGTFDHDAFNSQVLTEMTLSGLELMLERIEKSQEVIATSRALLKRMKKRKRYWANQTDRRNVMTPPSV